MTKLYVLTADERVDIVWRGITGFAHKYPVVRVWTGIQFVEIVSGANSLLQDGDLRKWTEDVAAKLRETIRVAMDDAREGAKA